ncbi:outer membrane beta-barrel protein [Oricola sp.]|uniref:outer membrane protein n=1 Tax=Oricola sp. TaxID=1979950 RepID=UPI0025E1EA36|nr:outer membrane beta-barrel protein [Oricola sp.]MCI5074596.1 outer membrane beta-barrel protein [Oricola sp.]
MKRIGAIGVAAACLLASQARAADMDGIFVDDANFAKPAELGSGWYIRGDIGLNFNGNHDVSINGNPVDEEEGSIYEVNNFTDVLHYNGGVGYRFNSWLRVDAGLGRLAGTNYSNSQLMYEEGTEPDDTPEYLIVGPDDPNPCNGWGTFVDVDDDGNEYYFIDDDFITNCIREDSVEYDVVYGMFNVYADLGNFHGFSPFVGAGIGIGRLAWREEIGSIVCVPRSSDVVEEGCQAYGVDEQAGENETYRQAGTINEGVDYRLGYSLTAGVGYDINENVTMEMAYKYMNFGATVLSSGDTTGSGLSASGYGTHQVNLGLRYAIW